MNFKETGSKIVDWNDVAQCIFQLRAVRTGNDSSNTVKRRELAD